MLDDMSMYDDRNVLGGSRRIDGTDKGWSDYKVKTKPLVEILTAEETRRRQKERTQEEIQTQLDSIFIKINSTYSSSYVVIYSRPHEKVKEKLLDLGYTLKEDDNQRDGYMLTISW